MSGISYGEGRETRYKLGRDLGDGLLCVVTLTCDETERDHKFNFKFVKNTKGDTITFSDRNTALVKLNKWFPREQIDEEFQQDFIPDDLLVDNNVNVTLDSDEDYD